MHATRGGLALCLRDELSAARPSEASFAHFAACARVGARLEREGETLLTERELAAFERAAGKRLFSVRLADGSMHRPDLIAVPPGSGPDEWLLSVAAAPIEVELSQKGGRRLDRILAAWKREADDGRLVAPRYYCSPAALPYVQRSAQRVGLGAEFNPILLPGDSPPVEIGEPGR